MKLTKKILSAILSVGLMLTASVPSMASDVVVAQPQETMLVIEGTVKELLKDGDVLMMNLDTKDLTLPNVTVNVFSDTYIVDNEQGIPATSSSIKVGDNICAYTEARMTRSIPPQVSAIAVITNIGKDKTVARYMKVSEVTKNNDGSIKVLSDDMQYLITILPTVSIAPFKTKQMVTIEDIGVGSELFVWFDVMTLSIPAQATADKVVIIKTKADAKEPALGSPNEISIKKNAGLLKETAKLYVNGTELSIAETELFGKYEEVMVPLKVVAEQLGFTVEWIGETRTIVMRKGGLWTEIQIGYDSYLKEGEVPNGLPPVHFGVAPALVNDRTYVPAVYFDYLFDNNNVTAVVDGVLQINAK